eukprot:7361777-Pyramimonas_sp.AAC.2
MCASSSLRSPLSTAATPWLILYTGISPTFDSVTRSPFTHQSSSLTNVITDGEGGGKVAEVRGRREPADQGAYAPLASARLPGRHPGTSPSPSLLASHGGIP